MTSDLLPGISPDPLTRDTVAAGLAWIFDTIQPAGIIYQPHGIPHTVGGRTYTFVPVAAGKPVIVMGIADGHYRYDGANNLVNPLTADEVGRFAGMLTELGRPPIRSWNGAGTSTVSMPL